MHSLLQNLFDYEAPQTTGERVFFRLFELFVVGVTLRFCWVWGAYIPQIDQVLLPLGIANYLDVSFMFDNGLSLVNAALVTVLCGLGFFRILPGPAYVGALLLFHLQYVSRYCLGEISHGSNLIGMCLMGLATAMVVFREPLLRRRFALGFIYFFAGLGYTSAAFCKLIGTGLGWPAGKHLLLWIGERQVDVLSMMGTFDPTWVQELILTDPRLGTLVLAFGLLTEACGILMWWRRTRYLVVFGLIMMHVGILLSMNIWFGAHTYVLLLLGFPWAAWIDRLLAHTRPLLPERLSRRQSLSA